MYRRCDTLALAHEWMSNMILAYVNSVLSHTCRVSSAEKMQMGICDGLSMPQPLLAHSGNIFGCLPTPFVLPSMSSDISVGMLSEIRNQMQIDENGVWTGSIIINKIIYIIYFQLK